MAEPVEQAVNDAARLPRREEPRRARLVAAPYMLGQFASLFVPEEEEDEDVELGEGLAL